MKDKGKKIINKFKSRKLLLFILGVFTILSSFSSNLLNVKADTPVNIAKKEDTGYRHTGQIANEQGGVTFFDNQTIDKLFMTDGNIGFCVEPSKLVTDMNGYTASEIDRQDLSRIQYHGYWNTGKTMYDYAVTQLMIWEQFNYFPTHNVPNYETRKMEINQLINTHRVTPSFHGTSHTINLGESLILTDTNNVLSQFFNWKAIGCDVKVNGNQLVITPSINTPDTITISASKYVDIFIGTSYIYRHANSQAIMSGKLSDPILLRINLKVNKYVDVTLNKEDLETGNLPQGDARLLGAKYGLFKSDNTLIKEKTINDDLTLKFEKLMCTDTYYIQETQAPQGYVLNEEKIEINPLELLNNGTVGVDLQYSVTSKEQIVKGKHQIFKTSTSGASGILMPLANAEFTYKLLSEVNEEGWDNATTYDVITTDNLGIATTKDLPFGTYLVKETYTPQDKIKAPDFIITIDENDKTYFNAINNAPFKSYLKIVKQDMNGNNVVLSNATFVIKDEKGEIVKQKVADKYVSEFTTNEKGEITTPLMLNSGIYTIDEIKTPKGFLTLEEPVQFTITNQHDYDVDEDNDPVVTVVVKNDKPIAEIVINKSFENSQDNALGGAVFKLTANSQIVDPATNEIIYNVGDPVNVDIAEDGLYMVNESGQLTIAGLPMSDGKASYKLQEVSTLDGYVLDTKEYIFNFEQENLTQKVYTKTINIENKLKKPLIHTTAFNKETGNKFFDPVENITVTDIVEYQDLNENQEYTMHGVIMDKETGKPLVLNGKKVTNEITFIPTSSNGKVEMSFTFNALNLANKELVVFEELKTIVDNELVTVAEHKDINDKNQTVKIKNVVKTDDTTNRTILLFCAGISLSAIVILIILRLKEKKIKIN